MTMRGSRGVSPFRSRADRCVTVAGRFDRPPDVVLAEDYPLVVTIPARSLDGVRPVLPAARDGHTAAAKNRPARHPR